MIRTIEPCQECTGQRVFRVAVFRVTLLRIAVFRVARELARGRAAQPRDSSRAPRSKTRACSDRTKRAIPCVEVKSPVNDADDPDGRESLQSDRQRHWDQSHRRAAATTMYRRDTDGSVSRPAPPTLEMPDARR